MGDVAGRPLSSRSLCCRRVSAASRPLGPRNQGADDPKVIADWNTVAFDTIIIDAGKAAVEGFIGSR